MLVKTRTILLKTLKYAENSVIARFYTEEFGLESFIINNIRSKKAAINAAHLQPLSLAETDLYQRANANLQRIKELRCQPVLHSLYTDIAKTSAVLFMQEVLNKVIIEKEKNEALFSFLYHHICWADAVPKLPAAYPVYWLVQLSRHLGFFPDIDSWEPDTVFLPAQGVFTHETGHPLYFDTTNAKYLYDLCLAKPETIDSIGISASYRRQLLDALLHYYRLHIDGFGEVKAHKVLAEVLA